MFFLATADREGRPQCSYKGGEPGFVRVLDQHTVAFPNYDGNGMYLSMGNLSVNPQVGMLFIDFVSERPSRLRLNGLAHIDEDDERSRPSRRRSSSSGLAPPRFSRTVLVTSTGWSSSIALASSHIADAPRLSRIGNELTGPATYSQDRPHAAQLTHGIKVTHPSGYLTFTPSLLGKPAATNARGHNPATAMAPWCPCSIDQRTPGTGADASAVSQANAYEQRLGRC